MKKIFLLIFFIFTISLILGQSLNITYPQEIDSFPGQVVNIPIITENISNQVLTVQPDYFSSFHSDDFPYRINRVSPRVLQPGRRELIFLSLSPDNNLLAGKRFFPFVIKDDRERILSRGVVEITHVINEDFAVIPLDDFRYIIPDINLGKSYLLLNRGTVPVEFKLSNIVVQTRETMTWDDKNIIIQPGQADTLFIHFSEISNLVQSEYWISYSLDYTLTKILPDSLKVENYSIRRVIPIAYRTDFPFKREFYKIPVTISQSFMFDESKFSQRNYITQYITNIYGNGFIDDYPSPYLNFHVNYRHTDYGFRDDDDIYFNLNWRTSNFNIAAGENSYILDLQSSPRYGMGLELAYFNRGIFIERVFMKELYGEEAIHNRTSIGYSWDTDSFLFSPEQFVRFNYYQKNNRDSTDVWIGENGIDDNFQTYLNRWFVNSEHEKFILDAQIRLLRNLRLNFEIYTARENENNNFTSPAFSTELFFQSRYLINKFSMLYDDLNIINEIPRRIHYNNELSFQSNFLDLYSNYRYKDEYSRLGNSFTDNYITHNFSTNVYLLLGWDTYLRFRLYDTATNFMGSAKTSYEENEYLMGLMYKKSGLEYELMYGLRNENLNEYYEKYSNIISFNAWFSRWDGSINFPNSNINNINLFINSRAEFDENRFEIKNQANLFNRWTNSLHQSIGVFHIYHSEDNWRNNFLIFTNFFYSFPWQHHITFGGSYNINPSFADQYRYSLLFEYSIPLNMKLLPKPNRKYMTLTFLDHWQNKPVRGAVFEMDNKYFVSNNAGVIRTKRDEFNPHAISIVNMPPGFTLEPDLSFLTEMSGHKATFRFAELGRININIKKLTYERIPPVDIDNFNNIAYYQNTLINLDNYSIDGYFQPLEIMLRNIDTNTITHRAIINELGDAMFFGLTAGTYEIMINDSLTIDDLTLERHIFRIEHGDILERELVVEERYTRFQRFE